MGMTDQGLPWCDYGRARGSGWLLELGKCMAMARDYGKRSGYLGQYSENPLLQLSGRMVAFAHLVTKSWVSQN